MATRQPPKPPGPKKPAPPPSAKRDKRPLTGTLTGSAASRASVIAVTKSSKPAAAVATAPPRSPPAKENAEALVARLFELDRKTKADFYEMGLVLRELKKPVHLSALGFRTLDDLLNGRKLPKRAMAYRLLAVVDNLDRDTAQQVGVERAYHAQPAARPPPFAAW
jgi:hypothetical protein